MKLIERPALLDRLSDLRGTPDIKIITGIRRSGKSQLMKDYIDRIRTVEPDVNIIVIDYVNLAFENLKEYHMLYRYIEDHTISGKDNILFIEDKNIAQQYTDYYNKMWESFDTIITQEEAKKYLENEKKAEQEKMQVVLNNQKTEKQNKVSSLTEEEKKLSAQIDEYNKALQQIEAAARRASRVSYTSNTKFVGGKMLWPCPSSTRITSTFGGRASPGGIGSTNHKGIDIGASSGAAIVAALDGKVVYTGYNVARGNYVMIDHGGGIITLYQHGLNGSIRVSSGQSVKQGQTIMGVGSTGYSTGPHLHFEVWENGTPVNPINYVRG